jgi:hypothetical protein
VEKRTTAADRAAVRLSLRLAPDCDADQGVGLGAGRLFDGFEETKNGCRSLLRRD